jgi:hypothetical protein
MMRTTTPRGRRILPAALAGGMALVVGLVCGALLFGAGGQRPPGTGTASTAQPEPASPTQPPGSPPATAPRPGGEATAPEEPPPDVTVIEVQGARLPASGSAGPWESRGGLARGFARDRAGVALAAAHILVRVHPEVGADVFGPTLADQVVGPYADALVTNVAYGYEQLLNRWPVAYGEPAGSLHLTVRGYRIDAFTDDDTSVSLLLEVPDGDGSLLGSTGLRMRWHEGDWALVAPVDGAFTGTSLVEDTSAFTLWTQETP